MTFNLNKLFKQTVLIAGAITCFASCNKDKIDAVPITTTPSSTTQSIAEIVNTDPGFTILKAAVTRAGTNISSLLGDRTGAFTLFAPTDAAFAASGISLAAINAMPAAQVESILRYHIVGGQQIKSTDSVLLQFPNLQLPTQLVLAPPSASLPPGLRMSIFPSKRGNNLWANNIPLTQTDIPAFNGVIHKTATLVAPPTQFLWDRINADPNLTYLKAAIQRADSGTVAAATLQTALLNPAASLTVFAPNNQAFQTALTGQITLALIPVITQQLIPVITAQLIAGGATPAEAAAQAPALASQQAPAIALSQATALASTPAVFSNPLLFGALSSQTVKGLVVYHLLGVRAFSVNLPTTSFATKTLLNTAIPIHPGVTVQATFGPTGVTAATVKGLANPSNSNILINPTPAPGGTSDQHYINGVLHVIDQALRPQ